MFKLRTFYPTQEGIALSRHPGQSVPDSKKVILSRNNFSHQVSVFHGKYVIMSEKALLFLTPFTTTYPWEINLPDNRSQQKVLEKLNLEPNSRLKLLSITEPDIFSVISNLRFHGFH